MGDAGRGIHEKQGWFANVTDAPSMKTDVTVGVVRTKLARIQALRAREAKVLAALNHPNIAQVYGFEDNAIAMELVDGPTLADRLAPGPIPVDEALAIAAQIADAPDLAHEKGIVHRDLKPANSKITSSGTVKVLDFGIGRS